MRPRAAAKRCCCARLGSSLHAVPRPRGAAHSLGGPYGPADCFGCTIPGEIVGRNILLQGLCKSRVGSSGGTPRRASRGPTKVDYVFRWRFTSFTSKGPRHQGAVWRLRLSNKEQGAYLKAYLRRWRKHQLAPSSKEVFDLSRLRATFPQRVLSSPSFSRPTRLTSSWYD